LPFNFDKTETAGKFADFAVSYARAGAQGTAKVSPAEVLNDAINYMQPALAAQPDNPILWERMATLYLYQGILSGKPAGSNAAAEDAANKASALAPSREESYVTLAQVKEFEGDVAGAQGLISQAIKIFPGDFNLTVQLAATYRAQGKLDLAAASIEQALDKGYTFGSYAEMNWLIKYYAAQKNFDKAIVLQEQAEKIEPSNEQVFVDLAHLYAAAGQNSQALNLAKSIMSFDTTTTPQMQALINSLPKTASSTPTKK
jgi:tetratricopeptide (TPR) repeat protein